jgi:hypothetical protein
MRNFRSGERVMNGTNDRDCGTVVEVKPGCDANDHVIVRWDSGETDGCGADCLNSLERGPYYVPKKPQLEIIEPSTHEEGSILICDERHNDIAEFYHNGHATVEQSYETALALARKLVSELAQPEMTARQFAVAIKAFEKTIGPRASISVFLLHNGEPLCCAVHATGNYSKGAEFSVKAETFAELLDAVKVKWSEYEEAHRTRTIRKMALAIIRITAELGECTDAALRNCGELDPGQINAYGEQACTDANDIAGKGPFSIVVMGGANAEAA